MAAIGGDRKHIFMVLILAIGILYVFKLFQMQIINREQYEEKASSNSIKEIELTPLRGVFYDRNMKLVVENTPAYTVRITPFHYDTVNNEYLEGMLDLEEGTIAEMLEKQRKYSEYLPMKVKRGVDFRIIGWIDENFEHLSGVDYIIEVQRGYHSGIMGAHIFGYTKEINRQQLEQDNYYRQGDVIGYSGIEKQYEKILRGEKGFSFIVVDSRRREKERFMNGERDIPSLKGRDLVLSIDRDVQYVAEQELKGYSGAIVAIEPSTGEILALASAPDYDLNQFSYITPSDYLDSLYNDPRTPQYNRATMTIYPPGSTFKILAAIAGLESGAITKSSTLFCGGGFNYGRYYKCHGAHGNVNVVQAIEASCNTFFYQLIFKVGLDTLAAYANSFGMGHKTGIDLPEEKPGLIPTNAYYEKRLGENWPRGNLVSLGIGQGEISVTPLQLAHFVALVANNGKSFVPHVVKGYLDEQRNLVPLKFKEVNTGVNLETLEIVKKGMFDVVNGNRGTARRIRLDDILIAGKTGTAQNPHGKDHALFIAFAPFDNPKIACAVVVENSGFGSTYAAPIAQKLIETYLRKMPEFSGGVTYTMSELDGTQLNAN